MKIRKSLLFALFVLAAFDNFAVAQTQKLVSLESIDGRTLEAEILTVSTDSVAIRLKVGKRHEIPLSKLSPASIEKIKGLQIADSPHPGETRGATPDGDQLAVVLGSWDPIDKETPVYLTFKEDGVAMIIVRTEGKTLIVAYGFAVDSTKSRVAFFGDAERKLVVARGDLLEDGTLKIKGSFSDTQIDAVFQREKAAE